MTPDQLAELEVYLAAGFDFPTAMAMITPDAGDSPEPEPDSPPAEPALWHYVVAFAWAFACLAFSLWLFGR